MAKIKLNNKIEDMAKPILRSDARDFVRRLPEAIGRYQVEWNPPDTVTIKDPFDDEVLKEIKKKPTQEYFKVDGQTMIANLENKPEIVRDILRKMEEIVVNNNIYSNMEVMKAFNEMYIAIEMVTKSSSKNIDRNAMGKLINAKALADRILY